MRKTLEIAPLAVATVAAVAALGTGEIFMQLTNTPILAAIAGTSTSTAILIEATFK